MKIDFYANQSALKGWNSSFKVILSLSSLLLVLLFSANPVSFFVMMCMSLLTVLVGKIPMKVYLRYLLVPVSFLLASCVMIAWDFHLSMPFISGTRESVKEALNVFLRSMAGVSALYFMAFTTPMHDVIFVLKKWHVPGLVIELMFLIYRYIFILFEVALQMETASVSRLGDVSFKKRLWSFARRGGNLLLIAMKKANSYYDAMVSRGYEGELRFLTNQNSMKGWQVIGFLFYLCMVIVFGTIKFEFLIF